MNTDTGASKASFSDAREAGGNAARTVHDLSSEALSNLSDVARQATEQAKSSAASLASEGAEQIQAFLQSQVASGSDLVKEAAAAAEAFAETLDDKSPHVAGMIRGAAQSVDRFSKDLRDMSPSEILDLTTKYARRQPAIFVGAAVAAGFIAARFFKSSSQAPGKGGALATRGGQASQGASSSDHSHDE